ncbi:uncharacterized protein TNCV_1850541 [Trichonephila clavipes]|nr:uncharacterized protein TNCV_1850541 [Trichonephila clavipes]
MLNVMHRHTGPAPGIMAWGGIDITRTPSSTHCRLNCFPWPARSESFADRKHVVHGCSTIDPDYTPAATPDQLWQRVEAAWSAAPKNTSKVFFESMLRRVAAVISNNGALATDSGRKQHFTEVYKFNHLMLGQHVIYKINFVVLSCLSWCCIYGGQQCIKSHNAIHRLASKIYIQPFYTNKLILLLTPGHSNILLNDQADCLARSVTESDVYIDWIASEDISKNISRKI